MRNAANAQPDRSCRRDVRMLARLAVAAIAAVALLAGCHEPFERRLHVLSGESMGTTWRVSVVGVERPRLATIEHGLRDELDRVVEQMSTWRPDSAISAYNRTEAGAWSEIPPEFATVLGAALRLARDTDGAYDPTIGPLVELWGFGAAGVRAAQPDEAQIAAVRRQVGWARVRFDPDARRLHQPGGVRLDLSSIAKGFAVDRLAARLDEARVDAYLVEIGGEVRARGRRPDGRHWRVAIEAPSATAGTVSRGLDLRDVAVATSGDYRNHFEFAGRRYSHVIDPRSGRPIEHSLVSVTVLDRDCMQADALATALLVLGPAQGREYADRRDIAALFIERSGPGFIVQATPAFERLAGRHHDPSGD